MNRHTHRHTERTVIRDRIDYAKRLRSELEDPFDAEAIKVPVTVIWGDADRLCDYALAKLREVTRTDDCSRGATDGLGTPAREGSTLPG